MSKSQAHAAIHHSDHERREFTRRVHGADWDDPAKYDLVINTGHLSFAEAVDLTETTWRDLQKQVHSHR
jgi:cytidylate kinase